MMIKEEMPRGLGGWLTLLCIGLIVTPIWILVESRDTPSIFTDGSWAAEEGIGFPVSLRGEGLYFDVDPHVEG
jgi:hypothetical protein